MSRYLEIVVSKQRSVTVLLDGRARIPLGPLVTGKSKGENMESKAGKSMTAVKVLLIVFMMTWVFSVNAAETGAPPAGAGPAEVKGDSGPPAAKGKILSITFLGNKKITTEQLQKAVDGTDLKVGGPVGFAIVSPAMKAILELYKKNGATLSISPNIIEDPKGIVFVQFIIDETGTKGDVGGLVSSGGPQIFYNK